MNTSYKATLVRAVVILLVLVGVIGLLEGVPQLQASANDLVGDVAALSQSLEQPAALEPRNYYVSNPLGNDSWPGTQAQPFKTISRAVGAVEADLAANAASNLTVYIAGGTYREFINMNVPSSAGQRVIFVALPGEKVTVSGAVEVTNWSGPDQGVYWANVTAPDAATLPPEQYQVFVKGKMAMQAREPDICQGKPLPCDASDPFNQQFAPMAKQPNHYVSVNMAGLDADYAWDGSYLWGRFPNENNVWNMNMGVIESSVPGQVKLSLTDDRYDDTIWSGNTGEGVLIGGRSAVDMDNEWHYDRTSGKLYYRPPNGVHPDAQQVEFRRRTWIVKALASNVTFRNIDFFGGQVWLEGNNNVLDLSLIHI